MLIRVRNPHTGEPRAAAMILAITMLAVLTSLSTAAVVLSINNTRNAARDTQATTAFGAGEGGIAQALEYLRINGTAGITCKTPPPSYTPSASCASSTNPWSNMNSPKQVTVRGTARYSVWISEVKQPVTSDRTQFGVYRIHSTGQSGGGGINANAKRILEQDVDVRPAPFPIGLYANTVVGGGTPSLDGTSIFTNDCVNGRRFINITGFDVANNIPAGVHSTKWISTAANAGCSATENSNIHKSSIGTCNPSYPHDRDSQGGPFPAGSSCITANPSGPFSSLFTTAEMNKLSPQPRGLTEPQYAQLKQKAIAMGQYYTGTSYTFPDPAEYPNAVMYFDLTGSGGTVGVQGGDIPAAYQYDFTSGAPNSTGTCGTNSVVIVIIGGSVRVNSNVNMIGSFFLPDGTYHGTGGAKVVGTLFAKNVDKVNGTADFYMRQCFLTNLPGGLLDMAPTNFAEVEDR